MSMPLRTRIGGAVLRAAQGPLIVGVPESEVPDLRRRRQALQRRPGAHLVIGRPHRDAPGTEVVLGNGLEALVHRPATPGLLPLLVYFHGGGWALGDAYQSRWLTSRVAAEGRFVVVSVNYRLAPENPFPIPLQDCFNSLQWIVANAEQFGADPERLAVGGDSAGGNLAAATTLLARDEGGPHISRQVLIYPACDLLDTYPSEFEHLDAPILTPRDMHRFTDLYLAGADPSDPLVSPLRAATLGGLPPALVQTAEADPLRDNGETYARALAEAGVPTRLTRYVGAVHGYLSVPGISPCAPQAVHEVIGFLRD